MTSGTKQKPNVSVNPIPNVTKASKVVTAGHASTSTPQWIVKRIDNPGRGNCAFYAFAIGLIDIIQKQRLTSGIHRSPMFNHWVALDPSIDAEYEAICAFDFNRPDKKVLDRLQMRLRHTIYQYKLSELRHACASSRMDNGYKDLVATSSYTNFSALLYNNSANIDSRYNEYAASKGAMAAIRKLKKAISLDEVLRRAGIDRATVENSVRQAVLERGLPDTTEDEQRIIRDTIYDETHQALKIHVINMLEQDNTQLVENYEDLSLAPLFMRLLYGDNVAIDSITNTTPVLANSVITTAIKRITQNFFWGTHLDLDYLANAFEVNLHTLQNKIQTYPFQDLPERPVLTVNNEWNGHWTTFINVPNNQQNKNSRNDVPPSFHRTDFARTFFGIGRIFGKAEPSIVAQPVAKPNTSSPPTNVAPKTMQTNKSPVAKRMMFKEINDLDMLQRVVGDAVIRYCAYSYDIWFSLFHRHGETGRQRARNFLKEMNEMSDFETAKKALIDYLGDGKNGNTHPHSFRTMLLHQLMQANYKVALSSVSQNYQGRLNTLKAQMPVLAGPLLELAQ